MVGHDSRVETPHDLEILWLPNGEDDSGTASPIRVWKSIRLMGVGEAYRVHPTPGLFSAHIGQPRTTRIPVERLKPAAQRWGTFELTVVQTREDGGDLVQVMRRIA